MRHELLGIAIGLDVAPGFTAAIHRRGKVGEEQRRDRRRAGRLDDVDRQIHRRRGQLEQAAPAGRQTAAGRSRRQQHRAEDEVRRRRLAVAWHVVEQVKECGVATHVQAVPCDTRVKSGHGVLGQALPRMGIGIPVRAAVVLRAVVGIDDVVLRAAHAHFAHVDQAVEVVIAAEYTVGDVVGHETADHHRRRRAGRIGQPCEEFQLQNVAAVESAGAVCVVGERAAGRDVAVGVRRGGGILVADVLTPGIGVVGRGDFAEGAVAAVILALGGLGQRAGQVSLQSRRTARVIDRRRHVVEFRRSVVVIRVAVAVRIEHVGQDRAHGLVGALRNVVEEEKTVSGPVAFAARVHQARRLGGRTRMRRSRLVAAVVARRIDAIERRRWHRAGVLATGGVFAVKRAHVGRAILWRYHRAHAVAVGIDVAAGAHLNRARVAHGAACEHAPGIRVEAAPEHATVAAAAVRVLVRRVLGVRILRVPDSHIRNIG